MEPALGDLSDPEQHFFESQQFRKPSPVGMDIDIMGTCSLPENERASFLKLREQIALRLAGGFKKGVTVEDFSEIEAGKYESRHLKTTNPQIGAIWKQWIIVESGRAFAIANAVNQEHERQFLPDVEEMVNSITLKSADKKAGSQDAGDAE